ncbi:MAG: hypothetical protein Q6L50_05995 [Gloeomargarita sp. GMQP_bins_120]
MPSVETRLRQVSEAVWRQLQRAERAWGALRQGQGLPVTPVGGAGRGIWQEGGTGMQVTRTTQALGPVDWDVVVAGGTLGLLLAWGLRRRGYRVLVLERGPVQGRRQEWNTSRAELQVLLEEELLTPAELAQVVVTEYNPVRIALHQVGEWWTRDVLNVGVRPDVLLALCKQKFLESGGVIGEQQAMQGIVIGPDGLQIRTTQAHYTSRLLLDAMGHFSPLTQLARQGEKPEGVCLVVGGCAQGFPPSEHGDLLATTLPIRDHCQYFWEAFPAQDGRTTYLFTYVDTHPRRPTLTDLFATYFAELPAYQGVAVEQLTWQRFVFGFFPSYRRSPLGSHWPRLLPVGDSSGLQSPLSFGGFGTFLRHLPRLLTGISEALAWDALDRQSLSLLQPYQPNLSVTWLFQQVMRVPVDRDIPPNEVNEILGAALAAMAAAGDGVMQPFLQDVVQWEGLNQMLWGMVRQNPGLVLRVMGRLGLDSLLAWAGHYGMLALYTFLAQRSLPNKPSNYWQARRQEQYRYGSGLDRRP